jgi:hypothetical protein
MNEKPKNWKVMLVGVCAAVLVTGTLVVATPSIAAAPLNWAKIWTTKLMPKADKRYQPKPKVLRGVFALGSVPTGDVSMDSISFGIALKRAPTAHIIAPGAPVPAGCSGTPGAPSASPGHLCVFQKAAEGFAAPFLCTATNQCTGKVSKFGGFLAAYATGPSGYIYGSWALGVGGFTAARLVEPGVNGLGGGSPGNPG